MRSFIDNLMVVAVLAGMAFVIIGFIWVLFFGFMTNPMP